MLSRRTLARIVTHENAPIHFLFVNYLSTASAPRTNRGSVSFAMSLMRIGSHYLTCGHWLGSFAVYLTRQRGIQHAKPQAHKLQ